MHIEDPYNYIKPLIRERYHKSEKEEDVFNKFICLWISFNAFYSNCNDNDTEDGQIRFISKKFNYFDEITESKEIKEFYDFINNKKLPFFEKFNKGLVNLLCYKNYKKNNNKINLRNYNEKDILGTWYFEQATNFNWLILKWKTASRNVLIRYYDDINDLNAFLFVLYQVRCNLFHGGKNPENQTEKYVIEKAVPALKKFLEELFYSSKILGKTSTIV